MNDRQRYPYPMSGLALERGPSDMFDLTGLLMVFKRRAPLFFAVAAVICVAILAYYTTITPLYTATSQVQITTDRANVIAPSEEVVSNNQPTTFAIDTEVQVLESRDVARRVVNRLALANNAEFVDGSVARGAAAIEAATDTVMQNLAVKRSGVAFAIDISYSSPNPETAAAVANAVAEQYLARQLELKRGATETASDWLGSRLAELQQQVQQAEERVQQYRAANGLISTARDEISAQQDMGRISTELASARAALAERRAAANTARRQAQGVMAGQDVSEALNSAVIVQLRRQRADTLTVLSRLEAQYGPRHPDLIQARSQLASIDEQIQDEVDRIISGTNAAADIAAGRVASLEGSLNQTRSELAANSAAGVGLADLERNAQAVRTVYEGYLNRYRQTSTQGDLNYADARIISNATTPAKPSSPNLPAFLIIAVVGGIAAGAASIMLIEMLDNTVRTPDAVTQRLGLRTLTSVPSADSVFGKNGPKVGNGEVIRQHPFSAFTESLRMLRTSLSTTESGAPKVVAITSSLPSEGKSTVSVCLAQMAAMSGDRVVLVQCDVRRAVRLAANRPDVGLLEVLNGASLDEALVHDPDTGLAILPVSRNAYRPDDSLGGAAMDALLDELRLRYDLVILDTAPVLAIAETLLVAAKADVTCLLIRWGKTPVEAASTSVQLLMDSGANMAGAVISRVDMRKQKAWSRNDRSAYFKSVKAYYG